MGNVESRDGTEWEVFIEWEGRRPLGRVVRRFRRRREARARSRAKDRSIDLLGGCIDFPADAPALGLIPIALIVLILVGPALLGLLFGIVELGVVLIALVLGSIARTLFRRPWRVAAVSHRGEVWAWRQVGFRAARELVSEIVELIGAGFAPEAIHPAKLEAGAPFEIPADADLGLVSRPGFAVAAVVIPIAATIAAVVLIFARLN